MSSPVRPGCVLTHLRAAEPGHLKVREVLCVEGQCWYKIMNVFRLRIVKRFTRGCFVASNIRIDGRARWCGPFSLLPGEL